MSVQKRLIAVCEQHGLNDLGKYPSYADKPRYRVFALPNGKKLFIGTRGGIKIGSAPSTARSMTYAWSDDPEQLSLIHI